MAAPPLLRAWGCRPSGPVPDAIRTYHGPLGPDGRSSSPVLATAWRLQDTGSSGAARGHIGWGDRNGGGSLPHRAIRVLYLGIRAALCLGMGEHTPPRSDLCPAVDCCPGPFGSPAGTAMFPRHPRTPGSQPSQLMNDLMPTPTRATACLSQTTNMMPPP